MTAPLTLHEALATLNITSAPADGSGRDLYWNDLPLGTYSAFQAWVLVRALQPSVELPETVARDLNEMVL